MKLDIKTVSKFTLVFGILLNVRLVIAVESKVIYVDDIDQWRAEIFAGSANAGGFLEGPAMESGFSHGGSLYFLPSGDG